MNSFCTKCKTEKDSICFSKNSRNKNGLDHWCKECHKARRARPDLKLKDKEYNKRYYTKDKIFERGRRLNVRFYNASKVALNRGLDWTLTLDQYSEIVSQPCYYCNCLLGKKVETGSGLDRTDNDKGYIPGNCVSCCNFCNSLKSNLLTFEEAKSTIELVLKKRGLYKIIEAEFE